MTEMIDIYDAQKRLTGKSVPRGSQLSADEYWFSIKVCIFNSDATKLLIQKRSAAKAYFPNIWDVSVAGAVSSGELPYQAAERELTEELGLKIDLSAVPSRLTLGWHDGWSEIFLLKEEVNLSALTLQPEEVAEVRWVTQAELTELRQSGGFIPYIWLDHIFDYARTEDEYE